MAKGQKNSGREAKKPKADKTAAPATKSDFLQAPANTPPSKSSSK